MRPGQNKRMRGRNNNRKGPNPLTRAYESNGPDVKIRGTAQHIAEKYLQLARDAQSSGDTVVAESYLQHAEHYIRIIAAAQTAQQQAQLGYGRGGDDVDETDEDDDFVALPDRFSSPFERAVPTPPLNPPQPNVAADGLFRAAPALFRSPGFRARTLRAHRVNGPSAPNGPANAIRIRTANGRTASRATTGASTTSRARAAQATVTSKPGSKAPLRRRNSRASISMR